MKRIDDILLGNEVIVSDPCYGYNHNINTIINIKSGTYASFYDRCKLKSWGNRISKIRIIHKDYLDKINNNNMFNSMLEFYDDICVDSGTAGIFDMDYFKKHHSENTVNDEWYDDYICNKLDDVAVFNNKSLISSSGLGDGMYGVFVIYDNESIIAIELQYITDDEINDMKQDEVISELENLVHKRFTKESLENTLSDIFNETIKIELGYEDCNELSDYNYMFTSEQNIIGGDFDIYVLMHKNPDMQGNTMYVTEVAYDFFYK